jgi:tetratricopeptide (TPR) repeat protein
MEKLKQVLPHSRIDNAPTFINLLLTVCLLTLTTLGISCSRGALLDSAQAAWDKADYRAAADYYEQFLKENPESDKTEFARLRVATIYQRDLKRYDRAIEHYIHFIEEFPKSPDIVHARVQLGDCYGLTKKYREAISEYEGVLPKISDQSERRRLRLSVADMYFDLNDRGQALAEYQKVVAGALYDSLTERAYLRIGGIRLLRDEYEDAIPAYQTVASNTKDAMIRRAARFGMADCYVRTLQYDLAIRILEQTEPDQNSPNYIQKRIANIREQRRQRNLSSPFPSKWSSKQSVNQ